MTPGERLPKDPFRGSETGRQSLALGETLRKTRIGEMSTERHQQQFMDRVRKALGGGRKIGKNAPSEEQGAKHYAALLEKVHTRTDAEKRDLLDRLIAEGKPLNLSVSPVRDTAEAAEAIRRIVRDSPPEWGNEKRIATWRHPLVDALDLPRVLAEENVPVISIAFPEEPKGHGEDRREALREAVEGAYIGVTSADFCIADTATLVLRARPGQGRTVSLVPSIHIAVITLSQLLAELGELYALLKWDEKERLEGLTNCMTLISGPSKTADIEATMVHGAHGPRELHLFVITG